MMMMMSSSCRERYFVFMKYDSEYERLRSKRREKAGAGSGSGSSDNEEVEMYLSKKHDELLAANLEPGTYKKTLSLLIVDAFAVEITHHQANVLRAAKGVRLVDKNQELPP